MAKGKKRVIQSGEDVCCKRKLVADLGGKYAPAMLANVIHQWCIHNEATNKNVINGHSYTYLSYDWLAKNELPELSTDQVRTAMEMLIKKGIVEVAKIDRLENGRIPANYYRLSEKGLRYFPRYIDMEESPEIEADHPDSDPATAKSETELREEIKAEVYNEVKASVLAELKIEQRREAKAKKSKEKAAVTYTEREEKFFKIFVQNWNEDLSQCPICRLTSQIKCKLKNMCELYDGLEMKDIAQLSMYIAESDFLMGKTNENGQAWTRFSWSWLTKDNFTNLDKVVAGNYNKKPFAQWLKDDAD